MDPEDERIKIIIYAVLGGDVATEALKNALKQAGIRSAQQFFTTTAGTTVRNLMDRVIRNTAVIIARAFGRRRGVAAIFGAVPVVGSVISFTVDGGMCYTIANAYTFAAFKVDWFVAG